MLVGSISKVPKPSGAEHPPNGDRSLLRHSDEEERSSSHESPSHNCRIGVVVSGLPEQARNVRPLER